MKRFIALKILGIVFLPIVFVVWQILQSQPLWVESYYSQLFYPALSKNISAISSVFGFALHEIVVISLILILFFLVFQDFRLNNKWPQKCLGAVLSVVSVSGWLYFLLVFMWGLNHLRYPVEQIFDLETPLSQSQQSEVIEYAVEQTNLLSESMQMNQEGVTLEQCSSLSDTFEIRDKQINQAMVSFLKSESLPSVNSAEGRYFIFGRVIRKMGIAGLYNPLVAQPAISSSLPESLQAQTLAHEYAHLNGFADEAAADLVGYMSLWQSASKQLRYEAWLSLIWQLGESNNVLLSLAAKSDLSCIRLNIQDFRNQESMVKTFVKPVINKANDQYLKSSGHAQGVKRYAYGEQLALRYLYQKLKKQP